MANFHERLRELRIQKGFSQQDLADRIDQTKQNVSQYERGVRRPNMDKLQELFINDLISLEEYKADKEKLTAQIDALQVEAEEEPTVNTEALKQLQGMNFRGIYEGMEPDEKRRFWRSIVKTIWFDQERNIEVDFL